MSNSPNDTVSQAQFARFEERVYDKLESIDTKVNSALGLEVRIAVLETQQAFTRERKAAPAESKSRKHFSWGAVGTLLGALIPELVKYFAGHKP